MQINGKEEVGALGTIPKEEALRLEALGFIQEKRTNQFSARIVSKCGRLDTEEMKKILHIAENYGNKRAFFAGDSCVLVEGIPYEKAEEVLQFCQEKGISLGGTGNRVRPVKTCGGRICNQEVIDSYALADKMRELFYVRLAAEELQAPFSICVSGCPEQCNTPSVSDIGIVGVKIPKYREENCKGCKNCAIERVCSTSAAKLNGDKIKIDMSKCNKCGMCVTRCPFDAFGEGVVAYRLLIGGRHGKDVVETTSFHRLFTTEEALLSAVDRLIFYFKEEAKEGEDFSELVRRVGMEAVEETIFC